MPSIISNTGCQASSQQFRIPIEQGMSPFVAVVCESKGDCCGFAEGQYYQHQAEVWQRACSIEGQEVQAGCTEIHRGEARGLSAIGCQNCSEASCPHCSISGNSGQHSHTSLGDHGSVLSRWSLDKRSSAPGCWLVLIISSASLRSDVARSWIPVCFQEELLTDDQASNGHQSFTFRRK